MEIPLLKINKTKKYIDKYAIVVASKLKADCYLYHVNKNHFVAEQKRFRTGKNTLVITTHSNARELYEYALDYLNLEKNSFAICNISNEIPIPVDPYGQHRKIKIPVIK